MYLNKNNDETYRMFHRCFCLIINAEIPDDGYLQLIAVYNYKNSNQL